MSWKNERSSSIASISASLKTHWIILSACSDWAEPSDPSHSPLLQDWVTIHIPH